MATIVLYIVGSLVGIFICMTVFFAIQAKFHGDKIGKNSNGDRFIATPVPGQGYMKKGFMEGKRVLKYSSNVKQEGNYHAGKKNGIRKTTNQDMSYSTITFKNDSMEGYSEICSKDGVKLAEGYFVDGKKEGEWKFYTNTGNIKFSPNYKNDVMVSSVTYDKDGNTSFASYENGIPTTNDMIFVGGEDMYIHVLRESNSTYVADKEREKSVYLKDIKNDSITVVCNKFENINERYYNIVIYGEGFDITNPIFEKNIVFDGPNHFTDNKVGFIIADLHRGNYKLAVLILDSNQNIIGVSNQVTFSLLT